MLRSASQLSLLSNRWDEIHQEAKAANLSKRRDGQVLTDEERQVYENKKQRLENARLKIFQPIQHWIANKYGEQTMRYILSSTLINDVLRDDAKLSGIKPPYRLALIQQAANELGVDIAAWM